MRKGKVAATLVSLVFIGLTSCSDKGSSDSEVINTDYINRDNMSNSSTYSSSPDLNFDNNTSTTDTSSDNSDKNDDSPSALETNPQGYSKISGGNTGSTWSGD